MVDTFLKTLNMSIAASWLILAVVLLRFILKKAPKWVAVLLWGIVALRLVVPFSFESALSLIPSAETFNAHNIQYETPAISSGIPAVNNAVNPVLGETFAPNPAGSVNPLYVWTFIVSVIWCIGIAAMLLYAVISYVRVRRRVAERAPYEGNIFLCDHVKSPFILGLVRPKIYLPSSMDTTAMEPVIAHEKAHLARRDHWWKPLGFLILTVHWFNPLCWIAYVLLCRDIELACDEAVLRAGADRERYALALLGLEERRGRWSPSGSHFSGHALEERIKAIMKRKHISITALVAVLVVMCVTTTVFASAAPEDREDPHQNAPETGYVYDHLGIVEDNGVSIMSKGGENGEKMYSADDGKTWMTEERYHAEYGSWGDDWQVEWWTYEDYKAWLEEEKAVLQSMIGEQGYNGTDGWFTWDQKKVDETIALYESILEDIRNGALHSKTIIDKNGREVEDVALGSDGFVIASTFEEGKGTLTAPKELDEAALLEELKAFGIGGNANLMTYNGQLIRHFVDGAPVGDDGYSVQYVYTNNAGTVDVHTLRSVIYNPDGSYDTMGDLIGVAAKGDRGFDQELIEAATVSGPQAAYADDVSPIQDQNGAEPVSGTQTVYAEGTGGRGGKTFEEIFTRYADYGLIYHPRESGMGALTLNGQPVRSFADLRPNGSAFSYADPYAETGLTVTAQYDQNGKLTGLSAE